MIFDDFEQVHLFLSFAMPHGILDSSLTIQRFIDYLSQEMFALSIRHSSKNLPRLVSFIFLVSEHLLRWHLERISYLKV